MKLETCKGEFIGDLSACVAWLEEMQPAFAAVRVDCHSETLEPERYHDDWHEALIVAMEEIAMVPTVKGAVR